MKKEKKEKELPFFCETCDKGFKTSVKLREHVESHVKVSVVSLIAVLVCSMNQIVEGGARSENCKFPLVELCFRL